MANKRLFKSVGSGVTAAPVADTHNEAGGVAYKLSPESALAVLCATGTFADQYYNTAEDQAKAILDLCPKCRPEFVAKLAVYCRKNSWMKDTPAFLVAWLAANHQGLAVKVFPEVIDNGRMLRNFVQITRSRAVGKHWVSNKIRRVLKAWFDRTTPEYLFECSVGNDPSMADVIKLVHPRPKTPSMQAVMGYILGKPPILLRSDAKGAKLSGKTNYIEAALPEVIQDFEAFKRDNTKKVPDVPFQMLDSLKLDTKAWTQIAKIRDQYMFTLMNLNTFERHGVLKYQDVVQLLANRLSSKELIQKSRIFPYKLLMAYRMFEGSQILQQALDDAMNIACENVPEIPGSLAICVDVSGSMSSPITGNRGSATSKVRALDVAGLFAAAMLRKNKTAALYPFTDDVVPCRINRNDSILTIADRLAGIGGGATAWEKPLAAMIRSKFYPDTCIYFSDMQGWVTPGVPRGQARWAYGYGNDQVTAAQMHWQQIRTANPKARIIMVNLQAYGTTQVQESEKAMVVAGFSDEVFNQIKMFVNGEFSAEGWVKKIEEAVHLD